MWTRVMVRKTDTISFIDGTSPSGKLDQLEWTDDSQILTISTFDGECTPLLFYIDDCMEPSTLYISIDDH